MRVFISWSGELSRELAEVVRDWLPSALQFVRPYFTPKDIEKGAKWASEIAVALSGSEVCIIILTRENLNSNWIMFEAGAISTALADNSRVCPIVFDLEPTDLQSPLSQFQVTKFLKDDIRKLFNTINSRAGDLKLADHTAANVFEKWWPDLERKLSEVLKGHTAKPDAEKIRDDRELLQEILLLVRNAAEKDRARPPTKYEGSFVHAMAEFTKELVEYHGFLTDDDVHERLLNLHSVVVSRMATSELKTAFLADLTALIKKTTSKTKTKRKGAIPADDDDIPF
jgi:hypothetical protein